MSFLIANLKMVFRNKQTLFWAMFFPIFMMGLFGSMFQGGNRKYNIGLVQKSSSKTAAQITESLKKIDALNISEEGEDAEKAKLEKGDLISVVIIPETLADPVIPKVSGNASLAAKTSPSEISILYNESKAQDAQVVTTILNQFIDQFNQKATGAPEILTLKQSAYKSKDLKYIDFLLPGLLAMSLMMGGVVGIAAGITSLREKGVLKRLLVTPLKPATFFSSQVITRLAMALLQAVIMISIGVFLFNAHFYGSVITFAFVLIFGASVFLILGLVMSSLAKSVETVEPMTRAITMPMLFLGGVFFPVESMPKWLQPVSKALPLSYMSDALRKVISEGASLYTIRTDLLVLAVWGIIGFFIVIKTFRWE